MIIQSEHHPLKHRYKFLLRYDTRDNEQKTMWQNESNFFLKSWNKTVGRIMD